MLMASNGNGRESDALPVAASSLVDSGRGDNIINQMALAATSDVLMGEDATGWLEHDNYDTLLNTTTATVSAWIELSAENVTGLVANTTEVPYTPYQLRPETYIIPIVFAIIFIVGVLGNGTLVVVFLKHRTMRNVPNT